METLILFQLSPYIAAITWGILPLALFERSLTLKHIMSSFFMSLIGVILVFAFGASKTSTLITLVALPAFHTVLLIRWAATRTTTKKHRE